VLCNAPNRRVEREMSLPISCEFLTADEFFHKFDVFQNSVSRNGRSVTLVKLDISFAASAGPRPSWPNFFLKTFLTNVVSKPT